MKIYFPFISYNCIPDSQIQHSKESTNADRTNSCNNEENLRRCESEQTYVFKSQYPKARNKPYILNIKRTKEKEIPENDMMTSETNEMSISPSGDFYEIIETQKPRTQR